MNADHQNPDPERLAIEREHEELAQRILQSIGERDRDALTRYYLEGQTPERICREMGLTEDQFRLIKSGVKARFVELAKRSIERRRSSR